MNKKQMVAVLLIGAWWLWYIWWNLIAYMETWSVAVGVFMVWVALACVFKWTDILNKLK